MATDSALHTFVTHSFTRLPWLPAAALLMHGVRCCKVIAVRTTLARDDDVVAAAKAIASQSGKSIGEVASDLALAASAARNGIQLLGASSSGAIVTLGIVNALRDEIA